MTPPPRAELPRSQRIRRRADFTRIQDGGAKVSTPHFLLLGERREDDAPARLGVVASRKVGNAVCRNRAKRLIREAFRRHAARLPPGLDLVVVARPGAHELAAAEAEAEIASALPRIVKRTAPRTRGP